MRRTRRTRRPTQQTPPNLLNPLSRKNTCNVRRNTSRKRRTRRIKRPDVFPRAPRGTPKANPSQPDRRGRRVRPYVDVRASALQNRFGSSPQNERGNDVDNVDGRFQRRTETGSPGGDFSSRSVY